MSCNDQLEEILSYPKLTCHRVGLLNPIQSGELHNPELEVISGGRGG
jgi:hypothetical protein